jgi:hypothetical protein
MDRVRRFSNEEFADNVIKAIIMICYVVISVSSTSCDPKGGNCVSALSIDPKASDPFLALAAATASCHLVIGAMYARGLCTPEAMRFCAVYSATNMFCALMWIIASTVVSREGRITCLALSTIALMCVEVLSKRAPYALPSRLPSHLSTRLRKFQVVSLAQIFSGLSQPRLDYTLGIFWFAGGSVSNILLAKLLFFDFEGVHQTIKGFVEPSWLMEAGWVGLHLGLSAMLTLFGTACSIIVRMLSSAANGAPLPVQVEEHTRWMLFASMAGMVLCLTALSVVMKGSGTRVRRWRKRYRLLVRCFISLCMLISAGLTGGIPIVAAPWILFGWMVLLVGLEMYGRKRITDATDVQSLSDSVEPPSRPDEIRDEVVLSEARALLASSAAAVASDASVEASLVSPSYDSNSHLFE